MKKIGFIDYYIDQGHSNNYPRMIRESSYADRLDVTVAWEEQAKEGGKTIDEWCAEQNVRKAPSIEAVVEDSDCIVVLSPNNAERHEDLADLALRSGKPVYIDKTFAPSLAAARRLFEKAEQHRTPLMSSSALRFGSDLETALAGPLKDQTVHFVSTHGGGVFEVYAIHQLEMLVMTLGTGASRVMQCGNEHADLMLVDYPDGRRGSITLSAGHPFQLSARYGDKRSMTLTSMKDFFPRFIEAMLAFFDTGESQVAPEQTLEIMALLEAGIAAKQKRETWMDVEMHMEQAVTAGCR